MVLYHFLLQTLGLVNRTSRTYSARQEDVLGIKRLKKLAYRAFRALNIVRTFSLNRKASSLVKIIH